MRIRSIWPSFWTSLTLAELTREQRLCFIALWNYADDEGRERCDYRLLKSALFPLDEDVTPATLQEWVATMAAHDLLTVYGTGGKTFYAIRSWNEFQHPNKPKKSQFPPPNVGGTSEERPRNVRGTYPSLREGKGEEGKGRETNGPTALKNLLPPVTRG